MIMNTRPWYYLFAGGILEVAWAVGLKFSEGFSILIPSVFTISAMIACFFCVGIAMKSLPIGTAYAVFTGMGTAGTAIMGMLFFQEPIDILRIMFLLLLLGGITGLKIIASEEKVVSSELKS